jgi:hypothetical protein
MLEGKPVETIDESDLQNLITNQIMEGKKYDYKKDIIGNSPGARKEFLFDVSSFANCVGGHLILGMDEEKGVPIKIEGLIINDEDAEKSRLDQMIQSGLQPRMIPIHQIHIVRLKNSQKVIVIRISNSLTKPHMVTFEKTNKFYSRNSGGKYLLDVGEIRNLFMMSEGAIQKVKDFRLNRFDIIKKHQSFVEMLGAGNAMIVLHIIPLSISDSTNLIDVTTFDYFDSLMPMRASRYKKRYNLEGILVYDQDHTPPYPYTYTELFRNGCIESLEAVTLRNNMDKNKVIPSIKFEEVLVNAIDRYLQVFKYLEIDPPFFVMVSLLEVRGCRMLAKNEDGIVGTVGESIDRDYLMIPEVVIDSFDIDSSKVMKHIFDSVWNACGLKGSQNYDKDGNWILKG